MPGSLALVGSGEYLDEMQPFEADLIERGIANGKEPKFVQLATAAGKEGYSSLQHWRELGEAQASRIGVTAVFVEAYNRTDAEDVALAKLVDEAALIYLSGGDPIYLATSLIGTKLFDRIYINWLSGSSLAGCSAGAMALGAEVPNPFKLTANATTGLGIASNLKVLPHFDRYFGWLPTPMAKYLGRSTSSVLPVGIDENTALVAHHDLDNWAVWGFGSVQLLNKSERKLSSGELLIVSKELANYES